MFFLGGGVNLTSYSLLDSPPQAEFERQVGSVAVCDVGVLSEIHGKLFKSVQFYLLRDAHRPFWVIAQLHVMGRLQHLDHCFVHFK